MKPLPSEPEAPQDLASQHNLESLYSGLAQVDRRLEEALSALRRQSDRLTSIEPGIPDGPRGAESTPETSDPWEDAVRRFTGSIDVRLDILENELGGLQDELSQLQSVVRTQANSMRRRLMLGFLTGQALLAALILALFLKAWASGDGSFVGAPSPVDPTNALAAPGRATPGTGSVEAPSPRERASVSDTSPGVGTAPADTPEPDFKREKAPDTAAGPVLSQPTAGSDSAFDDGHADSVPKGSGASGAERTPNGSGTEPAREPSSAREPSPAAAEQETASEETKGAGDAAVTEGPTGDPGEALRSREAEPRGDRDINAAGGAVSSDGESESGSESEPAAIVLGEERFAVQLISFRSESSVRPFAEEYGIAEDARFMHSHSQERDWYLVLLGDYPTRAEGTKAVNALPPRLRELEPWVRTLPAGSRLFPIMSGSGDQRSDE